MFTVSQSKVKLFRKCHRAYHNKYVEKLERVRVAKPLMVGRIIHDMVEAKAKKLKPFSVLDQYEREQGKVFESEREYYGDIIEDIETIMIEYFDYWKNDELKYVPINGKSAEHEFTVELEKGLNCTGRIDAIGARKGLNWLVEHKSFGPIPPPDTRWRDVQTAVYIRMMERLGWPKVDGLLWDYISNKPPTRPKILKSGKLSVAAIDTLPETVFRILDEHKINEDTEEARIVLERARQTRTTYFLRVPTPLKPQVIDAVFAEFMNTAREVKARHGKAKTMNIERHCAWCEYEPLCRVELMGGDIDFVRQREFTVNEKR
jgi:hypothetical protein